MSKIVYYVKIYISFVQNNLKISRKNVIASRNNELPPEPGRGTVRYIIPCQILYRLSNRVGFILPSTRGIAINAG